MKEIFSLYCSKENAIFFSDFTFRRIILKEEVKWGCGIEF